MKTELTLVERVLAPTPKFFRVLRTVGLVMTTTGCAILAAPIALPAVIVTVAGYLTVAGGIITAVSQVTVDEAALKKLKKNERISY